MVEARLLAEFRSRGVPVQRTRSAIVELRKEFGPYPLAHAHPFLDVEGCELVRSVRTESLAEDFRAGTSREDLVALYDLSPERMEGAIRFELIVGRERAA